MTAGGLRRFTRAGAAQTLPGSAPQNLPGAPNAERCEMCGVALDERHGHVVEVEKRSLACVCRACYLLFTHEGAAGGRYRAVPERYRHDPSRPLSDADWEELQIPVTPAFFFTNSVLGRVVASYPSPAGATECELDLAAWARLSAEHPLLRTPADDVEGVFVTRVDGRLEAYLVPIDACYALVGEVRLRWSGLDGGAEVRQALAAFLDRVRAQSRPLGGEV